MSMTLKILVAVALPIVVPGIAFAQKQNPTNAVAKSSIVQVRTLVQMISSNKAKLKIYCELDQLDKQLEGAERQKDREMLEALNVKLTTSNDRSAPTIRRSWIAWS
jgi:hypothetical protein